MKNKFSDWMDVPARLLMASLFLVSGVTKLTSVTRTESYMQAHSIPGILIWPTAAWEIGAAAAIVLGLWLGPVALLAAGWCLLTGAIFHGGLSDPAQQVQLLKNLVMAGGFLMLARHGAPHGTLALLPRKARSTSALAGTSE